MIKFNRKPKYIDKKSKIPIFDFQKKKLNEFSIENAAKIHDNALKWLFKTHSQTERKFRTELIDKLKLKSGNKVLITAAGTANDVEYVAKLVGKKGEIFIQDYSREMLIAGYYRCKSNKKLKGYKLNFFVNNALKLPFKKNLFDATFHFGGINLYSDIQKGIDEMHRVTKVGGRVVFGDEGLAYWLKDHEYGKAQITNNPLYHNEPPLKLLPKDIENVNLTWLINNCYYVISYVKSKKNWSYNLDLKHVGKRGGSIRTRHFGKLEGIDPKLRDKFYKKINSKGFSRVEGLERLIKDYLGKK